MIAPLPWGTRLGLLRFLWSVLAAITYLMGWQVLPHAWSLPLLGWPLAAFLATVLRSLYLAAVPMTARVLRGDYPPDASGAR